MRRPTTPIERLLARLESGETELEFDKTHGYLRSLLAELDIPVSSQVLVFGKTSLQLQHISPGRPRALYFNDDMYIGWVQRSNIMEFAAVSPQQGTVFYTLKNSPGQTPRFVRDRGDCLVCHAGVLTGNVPGLMVRSVFSRCLGPTHPGFGYLSHRSHEPVQAGAGEVGTSPDSTASRHTWAIKSSTRSAIPARKTSPGARTSSTSAIASTPSATSSPHSDAAALMVLEHQGRDAQPAHPSVVRWPHRAAGRPCGQRHAGTVAPTFAASRSKSGSSTRPSVRCVTCSSATRRSWATPISGTSEFAEEFCRRRTV